MKAEELLGAQVVLYQSAAKARIQLYCLHILSVLTAVSTVFLTSNFWLTIVTIASALVSAVSWWRALALRRCNANASRVRRALYVVSGYDHQLNQQIVAGVAEAAGPPPPGGFAAKAPSGYYSTQAPGGDQKLLAMIEESAFFSSRLQHQSFNVLLVLILIFAVSLVLFLIPLSQIADHSLREALFRAVALSIILLSGADLLGSVVSHYSAWRDADYVCENAAKIRGTGLTHYDVMAVVLDYSAVIEAAPPILPFIYRLQRNHLSELWKQRSVTY